MAFTFVEAENTSLNDTTLTTLSLSYPISMAGWIFKQGPADVGRICSIYVDGSSTDRLELGYNSAEDVFALANSTADQSVVTTGAGANNAWTHGIAIFDGPTGNITVYRDNGNSATAAQTQDPGTDLPDLRIGSRAAANYFDCALAEIAIWSGYSLTVDDRAALFRGFSPLFIRRGALVLYAPLWGHVDGFYRDMKGTWNIIISTLGTNGVTPIDHPRIFYPIPARRFARVAAAPPSALHTLPMLGAGR